MTVKGRNRSNVGLVLDPEKFYVALDEHRRRTARERGRAYSWREVSEDVGLSSSVFTRIGTANSYIHGNVLIKLLVWMGQTDLKPYLRTVAKDGETDV